MSSFVFHSWVKWIQTEFNEWLWTSAVEIWPINFKDRDIFTISTRVQGFFAFVSKCIQNANIQFLAKDDIVYTYWANAHFNRKAHSHAWTSMCISSAIGVHGWFISFYSPLNLRFGFMANVRRKGIENTNWIRASRFCARKPFYWMWMFECNDDKNLMITDDDDYCVINETIDRNITSKYIDCNFRVGKDGWHMCTTGANSRPSLILFNSLTSSMPDV